MTKLASKALQQTASTAEWAVPGYRISSVLFEGLRTRVLRGVRLSDDDPVILKMLHAASQNPADLANFRREFQLTAAFSSPYIPRVYDIAYAGEQWTITFEDIQGTSLHELLPSLLHDPMGTVRLALQICDALGTIHAQGIVHKDVNPSNIIYCPMTGRLQIIDFGIATELAHEETFYSSSTALEGTLAFISPEQTGRMNRPLDYRTDFYSLGVTLYVMLTGQPPFVGADPLELIHQHMALNPQPFSARLSLPLALEQIVFKLMAKDPEQRYQSAVGIAFDLHQCMQRWDDAQILTLGQGDIQSHFSIPHQLYGRKPQIAALMQAFVRTTSGQTEVVVVQGSSGIGKSALVGEIRKEVAAVHGLFIAGKFDQYKQSTPYEPFIRAFRELINTLMAQESQVLEVWRQRIRQALKQHGAVLAEVLPELSTLTGPWPPLLDLPPLEALSRFRSVIQDFVRAVATTAQPLVLFLDDLQWADLSSLNLIETLCAQQDQQALLLILAFRDNEVGPDHRLSGTLLTIKNRGVEPHTLSIGPLELVDITQMLADCLRTTPESVLELAELCAQKSGGNPFFLRQILRLLHEQKQIYFQPTAQNFGFNIEEVRKIPIADNVVDVVLEVLRQLDEGSQQVISQAACVGGECDLDVLANILNMRPHEVATQLTPALTQQLMIPLDPAYRQAADEAAAFNVHYRFAHDRVQQAALQLLSEAELIATNLRIGRYFERQYKIDGSHLIDAVLRLHTARTLLSENELIALSTLAAEAGAQAALSSAHDAAFNLLRLGIDALGVDPWRHEPDLCRTLYKRLLIISHHAGQSESMPAFFQAFVSHTPDVVAQLDVQIAMMESLAQRGLCTEALHLSSAYLARLGISIPRRGTLLYALGVGAYIYLKVQKSRLVQLETDPELQDKRLLAVHRTLAVMTHIAVFYDPILSAIISIRQVLLLLRHGVCEDGLVGLANLACVLNSTITRHYQLSQVAIQAAQKIMLDRGYRWGYAQSSYFAVALINGWTQPERRDGPKLEDVAQNCFDQGNHEDGCQALASCIYSREFTWEQIGSLLASAPGWLKTIRRFNLVSIENYFKANVQGLANLANKVDKPWVLDGAFASEKELKQAIEATADNFSRSLFWREKGVIACLYGQYAESVMAFAEAAPYSLGYQAFSSTAPEAQIFRVYAHLQLLKPRRLKTLLALLARISDLHLIVAIANANKISYGWIRLLMQAELCRLFGWHSLAFENLRRARLQARVSGYLMPQAFVNECMGRYYIGRGDFISGQQALREARRIYLDWGAFGKVGHLEDEFEILRETSGIDRRTADKDYPAKKNPTHSANSLDLESMIQASQAVSSELQFDTMIQRLMKITLETAGAQKSYLLLLEGKELYCRVRASVDPVAPIATMNVRVEELRQDFCTALAFYVARTRSTVVLADAHSEGAYANDPYMSSGRRRSIACLPIENRGECTGVLYVENDLNIGAFTVERMKILALLAAQGAISLRNVQYVESLKDKVRLENDLLAAQAVQEALLPVSHIAIPGIDLATYYQPAELTGGDWFGSHYDASKEVFYLQVGDVTGHGISSALVTAAVCGAILGAYRPIAAMREQSLDQDIWRLALAANDAVATTGTLVGRAMSMAFIGLNVRTGEGIYFNAAHISVYVRKQGIVSSLLRGGRLLGDFEPGTKPDLVKFQLDPGDVLFAYTDGLVENGAHSPRRVNFKSIRKILEREATIFGIKRCLDEAYQLSLNNAKPADDCAYVILRRQ